MQLDSCGVTQEEEAGMAEPFAWGGEDGRATDQQGRKPWQMSRF